jgi:hypothetical protein
MLASSRFEKMRVQNSNNLAGGCASLQHSGRWLCLFFEEMKAK